MGKRAASELLMLTIPEHRYVVRYCAAIEAGEMIYVIMEHVNGKDFFDIMQEQDGPMEEKHAAKVFYQLCQAVAHLHEHDIVHGDIKRENVMVSDESGDVKLIDFGIATRHSKVPSDSDDYSDPKYSAPELLTPNSSKSNSPIKSIFPFGQSKKRQCMEDDIWRLGVFLYMLLNEGENPFDGLDEEERMQGKYNISERQLTSSVSDLIQLLLSRRPEDRPLIEEVLENEWFTEQGALEAGEHISDSASVSSWPSFKRGDDDKDDLVHRRRSRTMGPLSSARASDTGLSPTPSSPPQTPS